MGMSVEQFEVYNALINFVEKLKLRKKNILANNKEIN